MGKKLISIFAEIIFILIWCIPMSFGFFLDFIMMNWELPIHYDYAGQVGRSLLVDIKLWIENL
jgi:hypothetical protein